MGGRAMRRDQAPGSTGTDCPKIDLRTASRNALPASSTGREAIVPREVPNDYRHGDPGRVTEKVELTPGESEQPLRGDRRDERPGDRGQSVTRTPASCTR